VRAIRVRELTIGSRAAVLNEADGRWCSASSEQELKELSGE
jgi:hypothetical protein